MRELKNKINSSGPAGLGGESKAKSSSDPQILEKPLESAENKEPKEPSMKQRQDVERDRVRKRERKALLKSL